MTAALCRSGSGLGQSFPITGVGHGQQVIRFTWQQRSLVCGTSFDTGNLLLDRLLRACMAHQETMGWGLCPEHQKLLEDGFVAMGECDPQRSGAPSGSGLMKPEQADRTGQLAHLKCEVFARVFNVPVKAG